jgi:hypothetical protein
MRIVFCKYETVGETRALGWVSYLHAAQFDSSVTHTINELVGRPQRTPEADGGETVKTAVTLQCFVSEQEFTALDGYTAKQPASVEQLLEHSASSALGTSIRAWLNARAAEYDEEMLSGPVITPVPLDVYHRCCIIITIRSLD